MDKKTLLAEVQKEQARRKFLNYFQYANDFRLKPLRHQEYIAPYLDRIANGEKLFLIVEIPPQHGKSAFITETFPSYFLGKNPDKLAMVVSYSEELYKKFGRKNREKFRQNSSALFNVEISPDTSSVSEWGIKGHLGQLYSTSILGGATGRGADLLIIDDPIKNRSEAGSKTIREKILNEYKDTFLTRLSANGSVIIIMTRWHEDDLAGHLLAEGASPWIEIKIPAEAEENDLLGREVGEPLAPEIGKDKQWLEDTKRATGARGWNALYQQRPTPSGGSVFSQSGIRYYAPSIEFKVKHNLSDDVLVLPDSFDMVAQSWDCTFKEKETSDFVAGQVWGKSGANYFMIDRIKKRMGIVDTMNSIRSLTAKHPEAIAKYIEDKANGSAVIEMLRKNISGIVPVTPHGGKEVRAQAVVPLFEAGNVYVPHPLYQAWVDEFVDELLTFPNGAHDDEVDSCTQALVNLSRMRKSNRRKNRILEF